MLLGGGICEEEEEGSILLAFEGYCCCLRCLATNQTCMHCFACQFSPFLSTICWLAINAISGFGCSITELLDFLAGTAKQDRSTATPNFLERDDGYHKSDHDNSGEADEQFQERHTIWRWCSGRMLLLKLSFSLVCLQHLLASECR